MDGIRFVSEDAPCPTRPNAPVLTWPPRDSGSSASSDVAADHYTVAAFCAAEGVSKSNFYLRQRRLAQPAPLPAIVPIRLTPPPSAVTPIEVALPSGTVIRFPADASPALLVAVLRGLKGRP